MQDCLDYIIISHSVNRAVCPIVRITGAAYNRTGIKLEMDLTYQLKAEDLVIFADDSFRHFPQLWWRYHIFWLALGFIAVIAIVNLAAILVPASYYLVLGVLALVGWPLYYVWRSTIRYRQQVRREYGEQKYRDTLGMYKLTAGEEGLKVRSPSQQIQISWTQIKRIRTIPGYAFIYDTEKTAYIIPERGVQEGDYTAFLREIQEWHRRAQNL